MERKEIYNSMFRSLDFTKKIYVAFEGWNDGDYFIDICNDEGGVEVEVEKMFRRLNKPILINSSSDFKEWLDLFEKIPRLTSKNGKHSIDYDMHFWFGKNCFVYNAYLIKFEERKLNWLQTFLGIGIIPEWIK